MDKGKCTVVVILTAVLLFCSCAADRQEAAAEESGTPLSAMLDEEVVRQPGGELFISMPADVEGFDPLMAETGDLINLLSLFYEQPLKYEADGRIAGELVESWEVDEAKKVFTFKLRGDIVYSDGQTRLTADDIIYSAGRVMALDGSTLNTDGSTDAESGQDDVDTSALPQITDSGTGEESNPEDAGAEEDAEGAGGEDGQQPEEGGEESINRYARYNGLVENMRKIDELTVELTMREAGSAGLHFMTFPVMNENLYEASDLPVGTGVYMVESYDASTEMVMARNPYWWKDAAYIERVVAKVTKDTVQELEFVESSIIDLATTDVLYSSKYRQPGETQVIDYMTNYYDCLVPNLLKSELQDVNVRQALTYAIDRREILATVLLNHGVPTNLPMAPDFFAYDSQYKISDYDSKMVSDMLGQAGYRTEKDGEGKLLRLELIVQDDRNTAYKKEAAKAIKKQLAEVGVEIEIKELAADDYLEHLETGNFDLAYCSFYLDIVPQLGFMFNADGSGNYGHVKSDEIDAAIENCALAVTEDEALEAYGRLQQVLTERVPQIGLYFRMNSIICDETIQGIDDPRQNMVYDGIAEWYNSLLASTISTDTDGAGEAAEESEAVAGEEGIVEEPAQDGSGEQDTQGDTIDNSTETSDGE